MASDSYATITYNSMSSFKVIVNGQWLAAVSPTAESPGYIADSEPEMDLEEEDGDDEKSEEDSIECPTSRGDDAADDDGDDLSEDDADDEHEEESSDSEEEEEEHLALTVPAPALHSSISASEDSDQTEPFEEVKTAATPPLSAYRIAVRISVRPHIPMPFRTPPLLPIPLPTSSFPLPLLLPSTFGSESVPEADMLLQKRALFTTPTGGYEVGESSVAATAWQIRPALIIDDSRRAKDRLIGRLRRETRYFRTLSTTYAREVAHSRDTLRFQELALLCGRMFPEESDEIERYVDGLPEMIQGNEMSYEPKSMQKAIEFANDQMDQKLIGIADRQADNKRKFDNTSRNQQNQQPFRRNNNVVRAYAAGNRAANTNNNNNNNNYYNNQRATAAYQGVPTCFECGAQGHFKNNCPKLGNRNQGNKNQAENGNAVARAYIVGTRGGNLDANVMTGTFLLKNHCALILFDTGADKSFMSTAFSTLININPSTLDYSYDVELADGQIIGVNTVIRGCTLNFLNHPFNIDLLSIELDSFDVIIGMDWLKTYHAVIVCDEKIVRVPFGNETLIIRCNRSKNRAQLNIISCTKTQRYLLKAYPIFLANITTKTIKDKSEEERLENVPIVRDFSEVFPEDLPGFSKIAKPMTKLTQKKVMFDWGDKQEAAFQLLKQKLCSAPILALPKGVEDFIAYCDASHKGLGSWNKSTDNPSLANILHKSVFIHSNTIITHDGKVQSFSGPSKNLISKKTPSLAAFTSAGVAVSYQSLGPPSYQYFNCRANMWYEERTNKARNAVNPTFSICCQDGKVWLPKFHEAPPPLNKLLDYTDPATSKFREKIRVYNSIFSFTSFGMHVDHLINTYRGLYTFRINSQSYHRIGSLLPKEGVRPSAIEEQRLKWTRNNQDTLRVDLYHNVCDAIIRGDTNAAALEKRIVMPGTFTGGPRYMMQNYQDAMAICRTYENPDLFITFASNPKWPEIAEMLSYLPGQKAHDRPKIGFDM
nr:hypothetical protein [Tanacetum cinerariifolium]